MRRPVVPLAMVGGSIAGYLLWTKRFEIQKRIRSLSKPLESVKDQLAKEHSRPGQGDSTLRRVSPDQGSVVSPPLSEQELGAVPRKEDQRPDVIDPVREVEENLVLHTSAGEMPAVDELNTPQGQKKEDPSRFAQSPEEEKRKQSPRKKKNTA